MRTTKIRIRIRTIIDNDGDGYHAYAPALKGCHAAGMTIEQARENLDDAIQLHLSALVDRRIPLPIGCEATVVEEEPHGVATMHFAGIELGQPIRSDEELDVLIPA